MENYELEICKCGHFKDKHDMYGYLACDCTKYEENFK